MSPAAAASREVRLPSTPCLSVWSRGVLRSAYFIADRLPRENERVCVHIRLVRRGRRKRIFKSTSRVGRRPVLLHHVAFIGFGWVLKNGRRARLPLSLSLSRLLTVSGFFLSFFSGWLWVCCYYFYFTFHRAYAINIDKAWGCWARKSSTRSGKLVDTIG